MPLSKFVYLELSFEYFVSILRFCCRSPDCISSVESQKDVIAAQRCSVENLKGTIAIDFVQQYRPSGSQRNIFELQ